MIEMTYPAMKPVRIGSILNRPRNQIAATITDSNVARASHQFPCAWLIATGASVIPMTAMIGPVTTGGNKARILWLPSGSTVTRNETIR